MQKLHHGDLDRALASYLAALAIAEAVGDHHRIVVSLSTIAQTRFEQGADDADAYLDRALALARDHGDALGLNHALQHQGMIAGERGDWEVARERFQDAFAVLDVAVTGFEDRPLDAAYQSFMTLLNSGEVERQLGRLDRSLELRRRAWAMAEATNNDLWRAHALQEIGEVLVDMGDARQACVHFEQALALWIRHGVTTKVRQLRALAAPLLDHERRERLERLLRDDGDGGAGGG